MARAREGERAVGTREFAGTLKWERGRPLVRVHIPSKHTVEQPNIWDGLDAAMASAGQHHVGNIIAMYDEVWQYGRMDRTAMDSIVCRWYHCMGLHACSL